MAAITGNGLPGVQARNEAPATAASRAGSRAPALQEMATGFAVSAFGIVVTDAQWRILSANPAYAALSGRTPGQLTGTRLRIGRTHPKHEAVFGAPARSPDGVTPWEGEVTQRHRNGSTWPAWVRVEPVADAGGAVHRHVVTFMDLTRFKREQDNWRHLALHDPLTGLANRTLFDAELGRALARAARRSQHVALLFIDLDGFKAINDLLGHAMGDRLLAEVAQRLRRCARAEDLAARLGGDEFTLVREGVHGDADVAHAVELVKKAIAHPFVLDGQRLPVTASIGAALFPRDGLDAAALARAADADMYRAKRDGRIQVSNGAPVLPDCTSGGAAP